MGRRGPPPLATWMLEHLSSGFRDEALEGDLLEELRAGRSDKWYWTQVAAACAASWLRSLRARLHLLIFALLWSMPAPAWKVFCDHLQDSKVLTDAWQKLEAVWVLPAFVVWAALHSTYLWVGIVIYTVFHTAFANALDRDQTRRAFVLAPLIFSLVYAATFVLLNLYWFSVPGLAGQRLATNPFAQVADLRMLAVSVRLPYLVALLFALWGAIPSTIRRTEDIPLSSAAFESSPRSDTLAVTSHLEPFVARRFLGFVLVAGLVNAMIMGFVLCRIPEEGATSLTSIVLRAFGYVVAGTLAGVGGAWIYWKLPSSPFRANPPIRFQLFALVGASGWMWVAPMVMFSEQLSIVTAFVAMVGAFTLASALRRTSPYVSAQVRVSGQDYGELFAESLYRPRLEIHGFIIAIGLYAAAAALLTHSVYTATGLLAFCAFLFSWKRTFAENQPSRHVDEIREATLRLARIVLPAVLVTAWALLDGVSHRNRIAEASANLNGDNRGNAETTTGRKLLGSSISGYESVILWPMPEKKQIVAPIERDDSLLTPQPSRPAVIRFDGVYRYVQPPDEVPGAAAHKAHGTPISVDIESSDSIPLMMDAHQRLSSAIRTSHCREIQVEIENRDNRAGEILLQVVLGERTSQQTRSLPLGQQPIVSTQPEHFAFKADPVFEKLRFPIPPNGKLRKFNEITVQFVADIRHHFVAPKIAIQQFEILAR